MPPAVAVMVCTPADNSGMLNEDTNLPSWLVIGAGEVDTVVLPTLMLETGFIVGKSDAVIVTTVPALPVVGEATMLASGTAWVVMATRL